MLVAANAATAQQPVPPPPAEPSTLDLEQLMQIEIVVAGSKRAQKTRDVPAFVSVVSAEQIREHGYRTLGDVLRTLPGFYVSHDRNYSYLGVRGFSRPGNWNSRVLLLLNGLRTNENVYDLAYIGEEFSVDMDLVERVEVIRGPGSALYGSNAFFAVINVVTRAGSSLNGAEISATGASYDTYAGRASYGRKLADDLDVVASATYSDASGRSLYYSEFDSPPTSNGKTSGTDTESFRKLFVAATKGNFSVQANNVFREKGVPTAAFATLFNDRRTRTTDALSLASVSYKHALPNAGSFSGRVHAGRYEYLGEYAYYPDLPPNQDEVVGEWWGADFDGTRQLGSRQFLTFGAEFRDNVRQAMKNFDPEPYVLYADVQNKSVRWGLFAQNEIQLAKPLLLYAGVRLDRYEGSGSVTSPRLALIYSPSAITTVKVLAGRSFRAPNQYELYYENFQYKGNPQLKPERIETLELMAEHFISGATQISATVFQNRLTDLTNQAPDPSDGLLSFKNLDDIRSHGLEMALEVNRGHGTTGRLSYALQRTENRATGAVLTNSPGQMLQLELRSPVPGVAASAALDAQYMSSRRTLGGNDARGHLLTNVSLSTPRAFRRFDMSATIYNVFGALYGDPVSAGHTQDTIQQDGRSLRVRAAFHY
jgi:iron complex outermembrane receptor protein